MQLYGKIAAQTIKGFEDQGHKAPPQFYEDPDIDEGLMYLYQCYLDLRTTKIMGGPIPWTSAREYAAFHGVVGEHFVRLWEVVSRVDNAISNWEEARPQEKKKPGGKADAKRGLGQPRN